MKPSRFDIAYTKNTTHQVDAYHGGRTQKLQGALAHTGQYIAFEGDQMIDYP